MDAQAIRALRTLRAFDQHVTAPLHGFDDTAAYYTAASSLGYLGRIAMPTLCISSVDDPFFPAEAVERARAARSPQVSFLVPSWGGHTGFVAGRWPWRPIYWAEERALAWLSAQGSME